MVDSFVHGLVLFSQVLPETLLATILPTSPFKWAGGEFCLSATNVSESAYLHFSKVFPGNVNRSIDEQLQRYQELRHIISDTEFGGIFSLISEFGTRVLDIFDAYPKVHQDNVLEWRDVSLALGQDLFTCATLAYHDSNNHSERVSFIWPSAIQSNNISLRHLLERGCSENHYHLGGSTQIFPLTWCYLMNHPYVLDKYFSDARLSENLKARFLTSTKDNMLDWPTKMRIAAWIRLKLFAQVNGGHYSSSLTQSFAAFFNCPDRNYHLNSIVKQFRWYAARLSLGRKSHRLDYVITPSLAASNQGTNRLLSGERYLLYQCFYRCFRGSFSSELMDLLYLYILIKQEFRSELIQTNGRPGFWNFADYQDRKSRIWSKNPAYERESYLLSIGEALEGPHAERSIIRSLEARIMPEDTASDLLDYICSIDKTLSEHNADSRGSGRFDRFLYPVHSDDVSFRNDTPYYFVLHFPKSPLERVDEEIPDYRKALLPARNHEVRKRTELQAKALASGLINSGQLCERIRGIDACSREIGCRPEVFSTAFRYLRGNLVPRLPEHRPLRYWPRLGATFHVGEDFLDLTDGLRAIDEAICFLDLGQGDRLGHALALGVLPRDYYSFKDGSVWLPAQDLLDNLVWLLYRSLEWDVEIPGSLRERLRFRACQLLDAIYPSDSETDGEVSLRKYYEAWRLRGDDPELYRYFRSGNEEFFRR